MQIVIVDSREYTLRLNFERGQLIETRLGKPLLECQYDKSITDLAICLFYMTGAYEKRKYSEFLSTLNGSSFATLGRAVDQAFIEFLQGAQPEEEQKADPKNGWMETEGGDQVNQILDIIAPQDGALLCKPKASTGKG